MKTVAGLMLALVLGYGICQAQVEVVIADRLVRAVGDSRPALRDSTGQLICMPGDELEYLLTATNQGDQSVLGVELVDPIPEGTHYVLDSAEGAGLQVLCSADQGDTYAEPPLRYSVKQSDGAMVEEARPSDQYTHIKWVALDPLPPGEVLVASLRVRVVGAPPAPR